MRRFCKTGRIAAVYIIFFFMIFLVSCSEQSPSNEAVDEPASSAQSQPAVPAPQASQTPERLPFAIFPAQERQLAAPEVLARGETVYEGLCRACHGADLRGGDMGGVNLLRSQVVLNDQHGELIGEVIQNGRSNPGMPAMPPLQVSAEDRVAVAEFIHSVWANQSGQGAPPPGETAALDIVVGDPVAGEEFFNDNCTGCHSLEGDLNGIASRIDTPENLQNSWVAGRRFGAPDPDADSSRRTVRVTVTLDNGETHGGTLKRHDDFLVSFVNDQGRHQSFSLQEQASPSVARIRIDDPLQPHRELLSELTNEIMHNVTAFLVTRQ